MVLAHCVSDIIFALQRSEGKVKGGYERFLQTKTHVVASMNMQ
jgi:hypothetical protein